MKKFKLFLAFFTVAVWVLLKKRPLLSMHKDGELDDAFRYYMNNR